MTYSYLKLCPILPCISCRLPAGTKKLLAGTKKKSIRCSQCTFTPPNQSEEGNSPSCNDGLFQAYVTGAIVASAPAPGQQEHTHHLALDKSKSAEEEEDVSKKWSSQIYTQPSKPRSTCRWDWPSQSLGIGREEDGERTPARMKCGAAWEP
jgi:hypothetical protein